MTGGRRVTSGVDLQETRLALYRGSFSHRDSCLRLCGAEMTCPSGSRATRSIGRILGHALSFMYTFFSSFAICRVGSCQMSLCTRCPLHHPRARRLERFGSCSANAIHQAARNLMIETWVDRPDEESVTLYLRCFCHGSTCMPSQRSPKVTTGPKVSYCYGRFASGANSSDPLGIYCSLLATVYSSSLPLLLLEPSTVRGYCSPVGTGNSAIRGQYEQRYDRSDSGRDMPCQRCQTPL